MAPFTIGRAARAAHVNVETIRFYERRGLVEQPPTPSHGGFRDYDADTVARIRFIRQAKEIGFSLTEISELLALRADPAADCSAVRLRAIGKRDAVEKKIEHLLGIREALNVLIARCPGSGAVDACTILDAMQDAAAPAVPSRTASLSGTSQETPTMKTTELIIEGMQCEGCAEAAKTLLRRVDGVRGAETDFATRTARILHDPAAASDADLAAAVKKAGFRVVAREP